MRNAAKMFSFDPNPTTARKAWSSSTCLLYDPDDPRRELLRGLRIGPETIEVKVKPCECAYVKKYMGKPMQM